MNQPTDIHTRLGRLSHLGQTAFALSFAHRDAAEMRRLAEILSAPRGTARPSLREAQRLQGRNYLFLLEHAEEFQAESQQAPVFSGDLPRRILRPKLSNPLCAENILSWEALAEWDLGSLLRLPNIGPKGLVRLRYIVLELTRAAELDGLPIADAGRLLLETLNRLSRAPAPKPRVRTCDSCGARHRIAA